MRVGIIRAALEAHHQNPTIGDFIECTCGWAKRRGPGTTEAWLDHQAEAIERVLRSPNDPLRPPK